MLARVPGNICLLGITTFHSRLAAGDFGGSTICMFTGRSGALMATALKRCCCMTARIAGKGLRVNVGSRTGMCH